MTSRNSVLALLPLIALAGCGDGNKPATADDASVTQAPASAETAPSVSMASSGAEDFNPDRPNLRIEEVLYAPAEGSTPFVELVNAGTEAVVLKQLTLQVDETVIPLDRAAKSLAPGARLLIRFDGSARADGLTYHAGEAKLVSAAAGRATLVDGFGMPFDEVAWGDAPGAVTPEAGGLWGETPPGTSIGRAPGTAGMRGPKAWVGYDPKDVTPGAANPAPAVRGLHPMSGARTARASLSWFPVPGAVAYELQVASDETFGKTAVDESVGSPRFLASSLSPGRYYWRVRARFADERKSAWSRTAVVTLIEGEPASTAALHPGPSPPARLRALLDSLLPAGAHAQAPPGGAGSLCPRAATPLDMEACWILPVPLIKQHKDTGMLLLERDMPFGPHAWDVDHGDLDEDDPADNMNCALASLAMMNRFAGGNLSQDRIGFEVFRALLTGPERDLMYGQGLNVATKLPAAYRFALGTAPSYQASGSVERLWRSVTTELKQGRPVFAAKPGHAFVIIGFKTVKGHRVLVVNDPWEDTRQEFDIDEFAVGAELLDWMHWLPAGRFVAADQEPSVTRDGDGDGVVDFDETERFRTKPDDNDSDADGVGDKSDIFASVFDRSFGYARFGTGRDEDDDGRAMELDPDSDAGGCRDGEEDLNGNGMLENSALGPVETWNFRFLDDSCRSLAGHLSYRTHGMVTIIPDIQWGESATWTGINVRLKPVPDQPGYYEDDGSTFRYTGSNYSETAGPECSLIGRSWASSSGDFTGPNATPATGQITDEGKLAVRFHAAIPHEETGGMADACGTIRTGLAGDSHSADFSEDCWGDPLQPGQLGYVEGQKTFRFACHNTRWNAAGTVTVP